MDSFESNFMEKENLKKMIKERVTKIGLYFTQTHGLPLEIFEDKINKMNGAEVLLFINNFLIEHPKVASPIYYSDIKEIKLYDI